MCRDDNDAFFMPYSIPISISIQVRLMLLQFWRGMWFDDAEYALNTIERKYTPTTILTFFTWSFPITDMILECDHFRAEKIPKK